MNKLTSTYFALINLGLGVKALASEPVVLPFHNIDGYIMINGNVDGVRGRFMFDTGTPFAFLFNNNSVNLISDEFIGSGQAGSGQLITIFKQQKSVLVNLFYGVIRQEWPDVKHADFEFIQKGILSDFIGMVGGGFVNNKIFSLDYKKNELVIYDTLPPIGDEYIKLVVSNDHLPEIILEAKGAKIIGYFDTGNLGSLTLTKEAELMLMESGELSITPSSWFHGEPRNVSVASLTGITYNNKDLGGIEQLSFTNGESNRLGLGYSFLKKNKSIWDLANQAIYVSPNW